MSLVTVGRVENLIRDWITEQVTRTRTGKSKEIEGWLVKA